MNHWFSPFDMAQGWRRNSDFINHSVFISVHPWFCISPFWVPKQRKKDRCFFIFIRTYERFWSERKISPVVFGLKTSARLWKGAIWGCFWRVFCNFWEIFCKMWLGFCKNRSKWSGFWRFWKRHGRFRAVLRFGHYRADFYPQISQIAQILYYYIWGQIDCGMWNYHGMM